MLLIWLIAIFFTLNPVWANPAILKLRKRFKEAKCSYLIDPSIRTKLSKNEYEVIAYKPVWIKDTSFNAVGDSSPTRVILVTPKSFSSSGKIPNQVVKSMGSRKVKLQNGFGDYVFEVHDDQECNSIFSKAIEETKKVTQAEAAIETKAKELREAEEKNKAEAREKAQAIKNSKSKALYD